MRVAIVFLMLLAGCAAPAHRCPQIESHFSPREKISPILVELIDSADRTVDIAAFSFTNPDIANALIRAHRRRVRVQIVMDPKNALEKSSLATTLQGAGIPLRVRNNKHRFQHSKYMVVDNEIVVTGSSNFTRSIDEGNSENTVVIRHSPQTVKAFGDDYVTLVEESVRYEESKR